MLIPYRFFYFIAIFCGPNFVFQIFACGSDPGDSRGGERQGRGGRWCSAVVFCPRNGTY